jgi:hypothetical protein
MSTTRADTHFRSGDLRSAVIADDTGNICRRDGLKGAPLKGGPVFADETGDVRRRDDLKGAFASLERHPVFLAVRSQTRPPAHIGKLACQQPIRLAAPEPTQTDHSDESRLDNKCRTDRYGDPPNHRTTQVRLRAVERPPVSFERFLPECIGILPVRAARGSDLPHISSGSALSPSTLYQCAGMLDLVHWKLQLVQGAQSI